MDSGSEADNAGVIREKPKMANSKAGDPRRTVVVYSSGAAVAI